MNIVRCGVLGFWCTHICVTQTREVFKCLMCLLFSLQGNLGDLAKIISRITIAANDDPYGKFVMSADNRPIYVQEYDGGKLTHRLQKVSKTVQMPHHQLHKSYSSNYIFLTDLHGK